MQTVHLQPAFVLHRRAYRETSFLVELFTRDHGRLTVIARGVRKAKSASSGLLQPFVPLLVSWSGKGELMTLSHVEASGHMQVLLGDCLFAGFYLNELLMSLLQRWDAHPNLFNVYADTIIALQTNLLQQKTLRSFEKYLLEDLGYGLLPSTAAASITPDQYYRFVPDMGFVVSELGEAVLAKSNIFAGKNLIAIAQENWADEDVLQDAKRLTRLMLAPLLGAKQIHSRKLFVKASE